MTTSRVPFDADKARAWNSLWEQRYAPGYVVREGDERRYQKPTVRPKPVAPPEGEDRLPGEPHSASVIRALERHINGGQLVPVKKETQ